MLVKLVETSATLLVTGALLLVTRSYEFNSFLCLAIHFVLSSSPFLLVLPCSFPPLKSVSVLSWALGSFIQYICPLGLPSLIGCPSSG